MTRRTIRRKRGFHFLDAIHCHTSLPRVQQCNAMCLVLGGRMFRFWCIRCIVVFRGWLVLVYPRRSSGTALFQDESDIWVMSILIFTVLPGRGEPGAYLNLISRERMVMILHLAQWPVKVVVSVGRFRTSRWRYASVAGCRPLQLQQRRPAAVSPNKIRVFKKRRITNYWMARCYHLFAVFCVYLHWFYSNINNCQLFWRY